MEALPAARRGQVQVLFVTLDPERDSAALLKDYVAAFYPQGGRPFLGLWGGEVATADFIRALQLVAERGWISAERLSKLQSLSYQLLVPSSSWIYPPIWLKRLEAAKNTPDSP